MRGAETRPRLIVLGNPDRGDDGAPLAVAEGFGERADVVLAGRPGAALLDLLAPERPCVLLDVTLSGAPPGTIHEYALGSLDPAVLPDSRVSSHGFGPGETFALARSLHRSLPTGYFIGVEGERFELGAGLSPKVRAALPEFERRIGAALERLSPSQQIRGS